MAVDMDRIIRPWVLVDSRIQTPRPAAPATDLGALVSVDYSWGASSNFGPRAGVLPVVVGEGSDDEVIIRELVSERRIIILPPGPHNGTDILRDDEEDEEDEDDAADELLHYYETSRRVSLLRVSNPSDSTQFVDVERIEVITFRDKAGIRHRFHLDHENTVTT